MLSVYYSNSVDRLAAVCAKNVATERASAPIAPAHLIVPSRLSARFLQMKFAEHQGVSANLRCLKVEPFFEQMFADSGLVIRVLNRSSLHIAITEALMRPRFLDPPEFDPIRRFVSLEGDSNRLDWRRASQLAGELASLWQSYAHQSPEFLEGWARGASLAREMNHLDWQRRLYLRVFAADGSYVTKSPPRWLLLPNAVELFRTADLVVPKSVHILFLGWEARASKLAVQALARRSDVHLYAFNPCAEFWDDLDAPRKAPTEEQASDDPAPLRFWGRAGREQMRAINELSAFDAELLPVDPAGEIDLLQTIQSDTLHRLAGDPTDVPPTDDSIRILQSGGVRAEVEIVATDIWQLIRASEAAETKLRFHEIAVYVPEAKIEAYSAHIEAVFGSVAAVPFQIQDHRLARTSRVLDAVQALIALPLGRCERDVVTKFVTHPNVTARYPDVDAVAWRRRCESLGVLYGSDRDEFAGTYVEEDVFNWGQAIRRLVLGAFVEVGRDDARRLFQIGSDAYLPEASGSIDDVAQFVAVVRTLLRDVVAAKRLSMSLAAWGDYFAAWALRELKAIDAEDEDAIGRCVEALGKLGESDVTGGEIPYDIAHKMAENVLASLPGHRGGLGGGVFVSALTSSHLFPFRVVYAMGLSDGQYPAAVTRHSLDARTPEYHRTAITRADEDRVAFLQLMMLAAEKLRISYVARDAVTGERLEPSSVVSELQHIVQSYGGDHAVATMNVPEPPNMFGDACEHARAQWLGGADHPLHVGDRRRPIAAAKKTGERVVLNVAELGRFLTCPLQGSARFALGLRDDDVGERGSTDEALAMSPLVASKVLRRAFWHAAGDPGLAAQKYRELYRLEELAGTVATGFFAKMQSERDFSLFQAWSENCAQMKIGSLGEWTWPIFGQGAERGERRRRVPAIELTIDRPDKAANVAVRIEGELEFVHPEARATLKLSRRSGVEEHDFLSGFIAHIMFAASESGERDFDAHVAPGVVKKGGHRSTQRLKAVSSGDARSYLAAVIRDLIEGPHGYLLPIEAVLSARAERRSVADTVSSLMATGRGVSSLYGPVRDALTRFEPPDEAAARAMIDRRFGLWFDLQSR